MAILTRHSVATVLICCLPLLSSAGDINSKLRKAAEKGMLDVVRQLVKDGAEINAIDKHGRTALYLATTRGHLEVAEFLVENGAKVSMRDRDSRSALDFALEGNRPDLVALLKYALIREWADYFANTKSEQRTYQEFCNKHTADGKITISFDSKIAIGELLLKTDSFLVDARNVARDYPDCEYRTSMDSALYSCVVCVPRIDGYRLYVQEFRGRIFLDDVDDSLYSQVIRSGRMEDYKLYCSAIGKGRHLDSAQSLLINACFDKDSVVLDSLIVSGGSLSQCDLAEWLLVVALLSDAPSDSIRMSVDKDGRISSALDSGSVSQYTYYDLVSMLLRAGTNPSNKCIVGFEKGGRKSLIPGFADVLSSGKPGHVSDSCGQGSLSALQYARTNGLKKYEDLLGLH